MAAAVYVARVSAPVFSEGGGSFTSRQSITLSVATPAGASVR
jgi:hypothetical protein